MKKAIIVIIMFMIVGLVSAGISIIDTREINYKFDIEEKQDISLDDYVIKMTNYDGTFELDDGDNQTINKEIKVSPEDMLKVILDLRQEVKLLRGELDTLKVEVENLNKRLEVLEKG